MYTPPPTHTHIQLSLFVCLLVREWIPLHCKYYQAIHIVIHVHMQ
jgi:hypothetical protein